MEEFTKKSNSDNPDSFVWDRLLPEEGEYQDYEFPLVTIVIPTFNNSQEIITTLDSILNQNYPDYEVLIIDADSTDRTLENIKSYRDNRIKIFSVSEYQLYKMFNRGVSQAKGFYINFLTPGDFYTHPKVLSQMMTFALDHQRPELVYCGTFLREKSSDVRILYRKLFLELLRSGHQPTSLQACWFQTYAISELGKFDASFEWRGGFDLFCRFYLSGKMKAFSAYRVLIDYNFRTITQTMVIKHFFETGRIIYKHFGMLALLKWLPRQRDTRRFLKLWVKNLRIAFLGK